MNKFIQSVAAGVAALGIAGHALSQSAPKVTSDCEKILEAMFNSGKESVSIRKVPVCSSSGCHNPASYDGLRSAYFKSQGQKVEHYGNPKGIYLLTAFSSDSNNNYLEYSPDGGWTKVVYVGKEMLTLRTDRPKDLLP